MVNELNWTSFWELGISEQRDLLQDENPDKLAGVFSFFWSSDDRGYRLLNNQQVLCCYPNQLEDWQIKLPDDFWEGKMVILNMWALRKGEIEVIAWNDTNLPSDMENPVLLSPWVIEYWEWETWSKYTQTVLRDGWKVNQWEGIVNLADANERTTTAWRNFSWNLHEDLEVENAEESPFLMQNEQWEYVLLMPDLNHKNYLIASIENYLENKYVSEGTEGYDEIKAKFEIKFKWVKYEDLGDILRGVIENDSFESYEWEDGEIDGIEQEHIQLWWESWNFYIYHDEDNNTIEYRAIRRVTWFPKWLNPVWRIPMRLFLESQNQDPSFKRLDRMWTYWIDTQSGFWKKTKLVPTINDFWKRVQDAMQG